MTRKHQYFVNEVLKHGDKVKAYKKVYPTAKKSSLVSASGRLMSRPEIDAAVNGRLGEISAEIEAEVRTELKPRIIDDVMLKERLSLIVMGEVQMRREVKSNGDTIFLRSDPGFGQVLRAGHMLCLMEGWYKMSAGKEKESGGEKQKQKESETVAEREPTQEERDEQRRKGMFINWQYWRIKEFYEENGQFYTSADQLRDKEFFLQRAFEMYGTKERPLDDGQWMVKPHQNGGAEGSGSWQEKLKVNDEAAFETSGDFSLAARVRNDDLDFSKSTSLKQTQFVNTNKKTLENEQNATKTSTSQSGTSSSDNNKNTNKIAKPEPPKQYNGRDQLKSNGYMNLQEMLKRYEWEAKNNRSIRAKVDGFPLGEDERIYMKYEILSHALTLPPEMCKKVFDSMGYELYAYNNNWFRTKR